MGLKGESLGSFPTEMTPQEKGLSSVVPDAYVIPASQRPSLSPEIAIVPVIDMASVKSNDPAQRSLAIEEIRKACISLGCFQIINHGISKTVMEEALDQANEFFNLPLSSKMAEGVQVVAVNCYPPCPQPEVALGLPPHTDHSCITTLLQSSQGLEIMDTADGRWEMVPKVDGALLVHVGDHMEVLSNGLYKSVVHRAIVNSESTRISITSLHSLGMDVKMKPAEELVNEQNPKKYKESSFNDFLKFLSSNDFAEGNTFINTLKIQE